MAHDPEEFSRTNSVTCYIEGIPLKISEKFRPPRKVTLPVNFHQNISIDLLQEEYPFELERNVLAWTKTQQKTKEEKNQAKAEQVAFEIERFSQPPNETSLEAKETKIIDKPETGSGPLIEKVSTPRPVMASMGNSILTPVPLGQQTRKTSNTGNPSTKIHNFNLADFESDTSSPFDNMELKTLNDIEELKSVLESVSTSNDLPNNHHHRNTCSMKNSLEQSKKPFPNRLAQETTNNNNNNHVSYNQHFNFPQIETRLNGPINVSPCNELHRLQKQSSNSTKRLSLNSPPASLPPIKLSQNIGKNALCLKYSTPAQHINPHSLDDAIWNPNIIKSDSDISLRTANVYSKRYSSELDKLNAELDIIIGSHTPSYSYPTVPYLKRNAKSTPDITQEDLYTPLVADTRNKICHSPPPRPSSENFHFLQKWNPYSPLPPLPSHKKMAREKLSSLPDPYSQLSIECQKFVNHVTDMGFPRPRVARTVQRLGTDDKQVIDHLCLVESFIEKGYNVDQAESALLLLDDNEDRAQQFLDLMCQFLDLGFKEEAIRKALILHNNDRDKALDYLVL